MPKKDPRVDAYIDKAADFAKPILKHFRKLVHQAAPEIEETLKWSMPAFVQKGIVCGMAAFKNHAVIHFWKGDLIFDGDSKKREEAMGEFGRLTSVDELPGDATLLRYIKKAVKLNEQGVKKAPRERKAPTTLVAPAYLTTALKKNAKARATWDNFSYSHRKEYIEWLTGAKREETRKQRLEKTIQWLSQGKSQNWRYAAASK